MHDGLFESICENRVDAVRAALAADASLVRARDPYLGSTPLVFAAHRGFREMVSLLLAAGADVHAREEASDGTALHWAAEGGHAEIARWLLDRGAALETRDTWFDLTPLGWAIVVDWAPRFREDRPATIALLRERGAQPDVFVATATADDRVLAELVARDRGFLDMRLGFVMRGMAPLHLAIARRDAAIARRLLDLGADPNARTSWGESALALAHGDAALTDLLRQSGASDDPSSALLAGDLAALDRLLADPIADATTLLFPAAAAGNAGAVAVLLRHGARAGGSIRHLIGERPGPVTPLHLAAKHGHAEVARLLLAAGVDASPGRGDGLPTPLHLAAGAGHVESVRVLLDHGADRAARESSFGATPLDWARQGAHQAAAAMLVR